jgi:hypothetical protein
VTPFDPPFVVPDETIKPKRMGLNSVIMGTLLAASRDELFA